MTSDSHAADAGENIRQERRPGPLVHRGGVARRPQPAASVLLPPLVARSGGGETRGEPMTTSSGDAGVYTPEPVVRDHLAVHGAGGAEAANRMGAAVEHADRVGSADDVSGEPVERAFGGDSGTAEPGSEALHEPTGVEEVDLPWLTTPEDEDALDTAPGEPAESPASQRGSVETPAQEEPASAVPILGETARKEAAEEPEARVGEGGKGVDPSEGGEDVLPEDPALLVAARLERIAHSLRTRGPSGPMVEQQDDPLAVLVTGYLLGLTESKGR